MLQTIAEQVVNTWFVLNATTVISIPAVYRSMNRWAIARRASVEPGLSPKFLIQESLLSVQTCIYITEKGFLKV